jgi:hypothetical protein
MLVPRCDGTAPTAGGSSERRIHLAPQPDQQAERRELREDGRMALGVWMQASDGIWGPAPERRLEIWPADQRNSAGFVSVSWPMEEERKWERRQCRPACLKKG